MSPIRGKATAGAFALSACAASFPYSLAQLRSLRASLRPQPEERLASKAIELHRPPAISPAGTNKTPSSDKDAKPKPQPQPLGASVRAFRSQRHPTTWLDA
jgi:hypothetical protein